MLAVDRQNETFLYQQVIDFIGEKIESGTLLPGDKLPSLRRLSNQIGVSIPTIKQAYVELERLGRVVSRPQSGFYVRAQARNELIKKRPPRRGLKPVAVKCQRLIDRVYQGIHLPGVVPMGISNPTMAKPAAKALHRTMKRVMSRAEERSLSYASFVGEPALRRQLAHRYLQMGGDVDPDDVVITNGGQEALMLALKCVASPGDVIAVESPCYHGVLELIESLGMLAFEIETCPEEGVCLSALKQALETQTIKACAFSSSLNNPLGSYMNDELRREMVELLEAHDVVLIEDDVYGDLLFNGQRPKPGQFYSRKNQVMTVGSFSKTAAPGYRIGWLLPGAYVDDVTVLKRAFSCSSGLLQQMTLAEFMASGDYDRHIKALRPVLKQNCERMTALIGDHFPSSTRVSNPAGGSVLWLELPKSINGDEIFERALHNRISIAPGHLYSPGDRYKHCLRLSFGHQWTEQFEQGIKTLGRLVREYELQH
ncbi:MAG: PLP-dependent aminotransferase family protein [Pseudomonadota bacterium]